MLSNIRLVISLAAAVLLATLGGGVAFHSFSRTTLAAESRQHFHIAIKNVNKLQDELTDAETGERGFALTGNEAFLEPYLSVRDGITGHLTALREILMVNGSRHHVDALAPLIKAKLAEMQRVIELRRNHDTAAVMALVSGGEGKRLMDSIRGEIRDITTLEEAELVRSDVAFQSNMRRLFIVIVGASLFTLLFAMSFAYLFYQQNQQRLKTLVHVETQHLLEIQKQTTSQLQQANITLQDSQEQLAVTLRSIGDAVLATDASARVTRLNPVAEQLTGWTHAQAIGSPVAEVFQIINKENRLPATIPVMDALEHGTIQGLANHTVLIARDGSECDIADSCAPIRDTSGQVIGAVLVFRDVTGEYAVQQALRDSSVLVQTILNTVVDGIITFHATSGIIETVNPAIERMFGYSAAELKGQNFKLLIPGFEPALRKGSVEYTGRCKNAGNIPLEFATGEMWLNGERYITGILRDITARKQVEEALLNEGALQSAIFNSANFSSIATDAKGVIQIFNVGAERMLGYSATEVMNQITPAEISDPQEIIARATALSVELDTPITPGFEALVFKASRGIEDIYELTYIRKDGSRFPAVVSVTALRDDQNTIIGYLLIGTDNTARKQAEEALLKAGALQSAIFNSENFSSIATDAKGVIQIFNVGAERMLGYTAAEVMDKITPAEISDPQEVIARATALSVELDTPITPGFEALVFKASRGIEDIYELTYIRKDGSRFPAVVSVTALRDDQNSIIGYLLIGTDNTARKQVEAERQHWLNIQEETNKQLQQAYVTLQISEEKFAVTINSIGDAVIATDAAARVTLLNPLAEQLTGWTQAEASGRSVDEIFHIINKETRLTSNIPVFATLDTGTIHGLANHTVLIARHGSECDIADSCAPIRDRDGKVIGAVLVFRDVTGEYAAQKALRDQQFYTRSLIESNIDAIVTTDPSGTITDLNQQMEVITGHTRDELIGTPFKNHFTDPSQAEAAIKRVLKECKVTNFELTVRAKDGEQTMVSYNAANFYDQDGILQGLFFAARDVTERKRVDKVLQENTVELEKAKAIAEKANLAKSDFLSSMSHELRSPLNAILGFSQLMDSDSPPPTPAQKESIAQILHAGWYLLELINEILDLAVVESGRLSLSLEAVSLPDVMIECKAMIEPQAQKRDINMTFPQFDEPCYIKADHTRVKQVLINLLSNAIKYNKLGGSVNVDCVATTSGGIRISVKDTGAGLTPENITQLFQPFNRLGQETGGEEGTGIGLVVSKRLVELMQGMIGVESSVGVGSVFWIELSVENDPHSRYINSAIQMASITPMITGTRSHLLLYVEDNPANLKLVEQLIARRPDLRLLTAQNGMDGINLARTCIPDVILMDINLPGISGIEAMKILRLDTLTAHIPILALSANVMPRDIEKGLDAGFFRYLTKPIKVDQFMVTLDEVIEFTKNGAGASVVYE